LLFASIAPAVAAARGLPVRALSIVFLLLLGAAAAEAAQITGSLLVFALLVLPAATAQQLTTQPVLALLVSITIGVTVIWLSLMVAYHQPYPLGFFVTTFAFIGYIAARLARSMRPARDTHQKPDLTGVPA
jgi:zinc/manganese transport system permease protein